MKRIGAVLGVMLVAMVLGTGVVQAENTGLRQILDMGCHNVDGTCYITVDGPIVGAKYGCAGNSIRWNADQDPGGDRWFTHLEGAFYSGKRITLEITGCYAHQPAYPTFSWGTVAR